WPAGEQLTAKGCKGVDHLGAGLVVVANWKMNAGRLDIECLFSDFGDQGRGQLVVGRVGKIERVAPPPLALNAGRHEITCAPQALPVVPGISATVVGSLRRDLAREDEP